MWDIEAARPSSDLSEGHTDQVVSVASSSDGKRAAHEVIDSTAIPLGHRDGHSTPGIQAYSSDQGFGSPTPGRPARTGVEAHCSYQLSGAERGW